jgi:hypothetical protein
VRTWRTPAGELVVEGPPAAATVAGYQIRTANGEPVAGAHEYYLLDAAGAVRRCYDDRGFSSEDELFGTTHRVVGDALVAYHSAIRTVPWAAREGGEFPRTDRETVEMDGLVAVPAETVLGADATRAVAAALAEYRQRERERWTARHRPAVEIRASFAAALDAHAVNGRVDLVFGYDDGPVVRDPDGAVLWRPPERPAMRGKDLHHVLRGVLEERYGDRLGSFRVDLDTAPWWFWAPDE